MPINAISAHSMQNRTVSIYNEDSGMKETYLVPKQNFEDFKAARTVATKKYTNKVYTVSALGAAICGLTGLILGGKKSSEKIKTGTVGALFGGLCGMLWGMVIGENKIRKVEKDFIQDNSDKLIGTSDILI